MYLNGNQQMYLLQQLLKADSSGCIIIAPYPNIGVSLVALLYFKADERENPAGTAYSASPIFR
jgi:hypothetical protein